MNNNANVPESFRKIQTDQYELPRFIVSQMLPTGVHLFAGSPKIGKSWLALWLCDKVAKGEKVWEFDTQQCTVLYIVAPEITLVNNTLVPVRVTVESMFSTSGGTLQFVDVLPADRDWANLNVADSKEFIALGLEIPPNVMEWNVGYNEGTYYAADMTMVEFGTLNYGCMGVLTLVANHGLAFDQAYTSMHSLFFMFDLV